MGSKALRIVQSKIEAAWGTPLAATAKWMGVEDCSVTIIPTVAGARFLRGDATNRHVQYLNGKTGTARIAQYLTFEDAIMALDSAVKGSVAPSTVDTSGRQYDYPFTQAAPAQRSRTLELYDGVQEYELSGAYCSSIEIRGTTGNDGIVRMNTEWIGKVVTPDTVTGSLPARTVDALPTGVCSLYIDAIGGTIGSTVKAGALIDWVFKATNGAHVKFFQGDTSPSAANFREWDLSFGFTLEAGTVSAAELVKLQAGTSSLFRIKGTSAVLAGAGTQYKEFRVDVAGMYTDPSTLWGDRDGNTTVPFAVTPAYDSTWANSAMLTTINKLTAFPDA